jgi:hypothetical protein
LPCAKAEPLMAVPATAIAAKATPRSNEFSRPVCMIEFSP